MVDVILLNVINNTVPGVPSGEDIINLLFPNIWVFLAHVLATIVLLVVVIWLAWKPTKKYLQKRKEVIQKEISEAEDKNKLATENFEKSKMEIMESKITANSIVEGATLEAQQLKIKMEKEAIKSSEQIKLEANVAIKKQEKDMQAKIRDEVSDLAFAAAESLISKEIDRESNQKIIDQIIKEFKESETK